MPARGASQGALRQWWAWCQTPFLGGVRDVKDVKVVVNYDFPGCVEDYVHRIGRTGRAGNKGTSYAFFTRANSKSARELVKVMAEANQEVVPELAEMARYGGGGGGGGFRSRGRGGGRSGSGGFRGGGGGFNSGSNNIPLGGGGQRRF